MTGPWTIERATGAWPFRWLVKLHAWPMTFCLTQRGARRYVERHRSEWGDDR